MVDKYEEIKKKLEYHGLILITVKEKFLGTNNLSELQCEKAHVWQAKVSTVLMKDRISRPSKGCPKCAEDIYNQQSLEVANNKLLPNHTIIESYSRQTNQKDGRTIRYYKIKCDNEHIYEKMTTEIGSGCPKCSEKTFIGQERVRLMFEAEFGKNFLTVRPDWLKNPKTNRNLELDGYCEELKLGFEYQGRQHASEDTEFGSDYVNQKERDEYKVKACAEHGVKLVLVHQPRSYEHDKFFKSVVKDCKQQGIEITIDIKQIDFSQLNDKNSLTKNYEKFKTFVEEKGYFLVSESLSTMEDVVKFKCGKGHIFENKPSTFKTMLNTDKYRDEPCLECYKTSNPHKIKENVTVEVCKNFAKSIGYTLLSEQYSNVNTMMTWQCDKGHTFTKNYRSFQRSKTNNYCPQCEKEGFYKQTANTTYNQYKDFDKSIVSKSNNGETRDLSWLKHFSQENNLELLSDKYLGLDYAHTFKCDKNHLFESTVSNLLTKKKRGTALCNHVDCATKKNITIDVCEEFAKENGLICLSKEYNNVNEKMLWQCSHGHVFEKSFRSFQRSKTNNYCLECKT